MKEKYVGIFWGAALILLGAVYLVVGERSFTINDPKLALAIFVPIAALFFASYYLSGVQKWGWLFPACVFTALSVMMLIIIITDGVVGPVIAMPILLGVGAPFFAAYFLDRSRWWALIPGYIMVVLSILIALTEQMPGELFATLFMFAVALPFLVVYLLNRTRRWALIPFAVIAITGIIPLLSTLFQGENLGGIINLLIGLPFLVVYFWSARNWWALIPAGIMISIAIGVIVAGGSLAGQFAEEMTGRIVGGVICLGFAVTFFLLWLRRTSAPTAASTERSSAGAPPAASSGAPTAWAIYPAGILALFALVAFVAGQPGLNIAWPLILIAGGGLMIYNNWMKKRV